ncbi:MAG: DUF58 domain-containing protein [Verrucomicrobia bacterium CG_4_10_14_3_um_filter_43_23]|nr:MAG: hypothetical protein AUJ82_06180 [Verrucomicrobia bacterium CG1_02_43_26]PIP60083.1 MAG: DUF58 domain-containing protein [Verrucomicrobia bacterium CG22_combo_CG10-13_8_21_14_all_43_17]PIX58670.1 MAG: DUF58 domain-containing protein [Verrucomicrobia bacterium CG_4_10_14_3_um_filter_43_23]PIY62619.1 MAG: DUF58 domain-containing protein [Verrucomicrobia bacterium CG_4_10_14_0_8_um_filter_43_34]PJA43308.1 MAG: DUF58 domain-containing protein [Verrucomicrobia bacterium CG_4_9_14_3_um_filter
MPDDINKTGEILRKVRQVEIRTNRMVTDVMAGAYHSVFKGRGMDFEEVREYVPGDDVRTIDWNVTAKTDIPHVKTFREERELTIILMIDLSASGIFGSSEQSKRELAAEVASVLAFSATRNNDKVGLILFSSKIEKFIPPKKGRQHALQIIRDMFFFEPEERGTDIIAALQYLNRVTKRKAIVFLISDFLQDKDGKLPSFNLQKKDPLIRALEITNHRHDLINITVSDPREVELPKVGLLSLEDSETGELIQIDTYNKNASQTFANLNRNRLSAIRKTFQQKGLSAIHLSTSRPYIKDLRLFMQNRIKKR